MNYLVGYKGVKTFATTDFNFPSVLQSKYNVKVFDIDAETGHAIIDNNKVENYIITEDIEKDSYIFNRKPSIEYIIHGKI